MNLNFNPRRTKAFCVPWQDNDATDMYQSGPSCVNAPETCGK